MQRDRYLRNEGVLLSFSPEKEIPTHLSVLVTKYPPELSTFTSEDGSINDLDFYGLFSGPISVAYGLFLFSLPNNSYASTSVEGKVPLEWAKLYLAIAEQLARITPQAPVKSNHCGVLNHYTAFSAVSAAITKKDEYLHDLLSYIPAVLTEKDDETPLDEWIYGRAGFLYLLRLVVAHCPSAAALISPNTTTAIISAMLKRSPDSPEPWRFSNRLYLSIGHGWFSPIVQILLSDSSPDYARQFRPWIVRMLADQLPSGNWYKFVNDPECKSYQTSEFIQIGHGAPGMVLGLLAIRPVYESLGDHSICDSIDSAILKAQDIIWERGLLTKETCLQHGAAGNSLVLLDRDRKATFLANSVASVTQAGLADGSLEGSSSPSGLHRGLIGTIWAMSEYQQGRSGIFPSFNDV